MPIKCLQSIKFWISKITVNVLTDTLLLKRYPQFNVVFQINETL